MWQYLCKTFVAILLLSSACSLLAQCDRSQYEIIIPLIEKDLDDRNYESAIHRLLDVRDICPAKKAEVNVMIKRTFSLIENEKKEAEIARKRAEDSEEKARTSEKRALESEAKALAAEKRADSSLQVVSRVLDQMYFYQDRFGMTLKEINGIHKYGFIDKQGNEVIPFVYEEASPFSFEDGYARVTKRGKLYLLDTALVHYPLAPGFKELDESTTALVYRYNPFGHSRKFPDKIGNYPQLTIIIATAADISFLPKSFFSLHNLNKLDLSWNDIEELSESIGNLSSLQWLSLSYGSLLRLPASLGKLSQLKELYLENNQIEVLPENMGNLTQLLVLDVSSNDLVSLPESIGQLVQASKLDFSENRIESLPKSIGQLNRLTELDLTENDLQRIPEDIGKLKSLKMLHLGKNELERLPESIGNLYQLESLSLENNQLETLPETIRTLIRLKTLYLKGNPISEQEKKKIEKLLPTCRIDW